MSEPKLVSPLLDQFVMGQPISEHHGVKCCPAMQKDSDSKYIVKIISIPASQRSVDALLLAGAFSSPAAAQDYFRELAEGVVKEAQILQQLSKMEGFLPYKDWQIEPMETGTGYDVYLLSDYRRSLDRRFRRETMTHLAAVNLGLDLCAALAVCRRSGYLFTNLKPHNVFVGEDQSYRIGDLGFAPLNSLQHASLPDRYRSAYTPPEIADAYCSLNTTVDTYALGLILYQAYNNGQLPFEGAAPAEPLPPPMYADREMSEIILKACDPNPENRWEDPLKMGKALVSYMQRNSVNDVPIVPVPPVQETPAPEQEVEEELPDDDYLAEDIQELHSTQAEQVPPEAAETAASVEEAIAAEVAAVVEEIARFEEAVEAEEAAEVEEVIEAEEAAEVEEASAAEETAEVEEASAAEETAEVEEASAAEETVEVEEAVKMEDAVVVEEAVETEAVAESGEASLDSDDDISAMLALADELIAHELPEPVTVSAPADVSTPEAEEPGQTDAAVAVKTVAPAKKADGESAPTASRKSQRSFKGLIVFLLIVALGLGLFTGGYAFYQFYYLQSVESITLDSSETRVSVKLTTDIDNALLTVVCKDTYGNTQRRPVANNVAVFESLNPGTKYDFYVEISGFHSLVGQTKATLSTAQQTSVSNLVVETGMEDGTAILSFAVQGPDTSWQIVCSAPGETDKTFSCIDHTATLRGLTPGVTYQVQLVPAASLYVVGQISTTYTPVEIVYAQDLKVDSFRDNKLTVSWSAPAGSSATSWIVHCYEDNTEKTVTVTNTQAVFEDLDPTKSYKIEVKAEGMRNGVTITVAANIVHIYDMQVVPVDKNSLSVTWRYSGNAPEGGWRVQYKVNGGSDFVVFNLQTTEATLPLIPGCQYEISVFQDDNSPVLNGTTTYNTAAAEAFEGYWLTASNINLYPCLPTDIAYPGLHEVTRPDTFAPGSKAALYIHTQSIYKEDFGEIMNLYVIKDSNQAVVAMTNPVRIWADILEGGVGILNLPPLPSAIGSYTVEVYFDGALVGTAPIQIAPAE